MPEKRHILFVDDEPNVLHGLRRLLRAQRHEWDLAFVEGPLQAIDYLGQHSVDVIVTDMKMPEMDGAELLERVRDTHPQTVRIALTGHADRENFLKNMGLVHQFLAKPCDATTLRATLRRAYTLRSLLTSTGLLELIPRLESLPSIPDVYRDIMLELQKPAPSIKAVADILAKDIGLTTKILRLVNSAYFGLSRTLTDIRQAVSLLGLDVIKALALSVKLFSQVDSAATAGLTERIWQHSLRVGEAARRICDLEDCDLDTVNDAYMAGLLHDTGKLVLAMNFPEEMLKVDDVKKEAEHSRLVVEKAVFGSTHAEVGAYLLGLWGLPDSIIEAIAYHHHPELQPGDGFTPLMAVHVADALMYGPDLSAVRAEMDVKSIQTLQREHRITEWWTRCSDLLPETA